MLVNATTVPLARPSPAIRQTATRRQIRGSSLLLVGRLLSMAVNFGVQILIVRYLSKSDYGAFSYALSMVTLGETLAVFGLDRAISRFVPIYHERREYDKLFGTLVLVLGALLSLSLAIVLSVYGFQSLIARTLISDRQAIALLLILIFLAPVQALDGLLVGMFAAFASPRAIFFRKHVLAPGLKLTVVLLLVLERSDVYFLAGGYLAAGVVGVTAYTAMLAKVLRSQGLFEHFHWQAIRVPTREVLAFTIPLLTTDLVYTVMHSVDALLLGRFQGTADVAAFRVVQPAAELNKVVLSSFAVLFTPLAARMFARHDREGINNLYWQTAIWIAVISFPVFLVTFSLSRPVTAWLYGPRYAESAMIMTLLAFGYYFHAALGFNGTTLMVYGRLRFIVTLNILAAFFNLGINLLLVPRYGALGAAVGTCGALVAHNLLKQAGLGLGTGVRLFDRRYLKVYVTIVVIAVGLLVFQWNTALPVYVDFGLAGAASLAVIVLNRRALNISETFPEVMRLPLARHLFGG